jgi:hypothetical protein
VVNQATRELVGINGGNGILKALWDGVSSRSFILGDQTVILAKITKRLLFVLSYG